MTAKITFKSYNQNQNQNLLFPPCLGDLIPETHPVRSVNAILDKIDIREIEATYKGGGTSSFHPRMLLKSLYMPICAMSIPVGGWNVSSMRT